MHVSTLALVLGLLGIISGCQQKQKPSVLKETAVKNTGEQTQIRTTDTATINLWMNVAEKIDQEYPDSAASLYLKTIRASKEINYTIGAAKAYYALPFLYKYQGKFEEANIWQEEAVFFMKQSIAHAQIPEDGKTIRLLYSYMTLLYSRWNDFDQTIATYHSAQPFYDTNDSLQLLQWLQISTEAGSAYLQTGRYDSASQVYFLVLDQFSGIDKSNYYILSSTYSGIGYVKARMNASGLDETLSWFKKAEHLGRQFADTNLILNSISNITSACYDNGQYDAAKEHGKMALELVANFTQDYNRQNLLTTQQTIGHTLAATLINEDSAAAALPYSQMSLNAAKELHSGEAEIDALYVMGYNLVALGRYHEAEKVLLEGIEKAKQLKKWDNIGNAYGQLSVAYYNLGQYKSAYLYRSEYATIRDSLIGKENAAKVAEISAQYHIAQKDKELAQKDKALLENQLRISSQEKKLYIWIGVSLIGMLILLGFLYQKRQKAAMNRLKATIAGEEKERSRLARELHDGIVSRLSIIKMNFSALPQQFRDLHEATAFHEVVGQLEQSIAELRTTSHNLLPDMLLRAGLVASLETYFSQIKKISLLDIHFQLIGDLPGLSDEFQLNMYRIIQELINNLLKHTDAKNALIQFHVHNDWLTVTIDNDGSPLRNNNISDIQTGSGIGLNNLHERIRLLQGTLEMEQEGNTSVYMEFNLRKFISKK